MVYHYFMFVDYVSSDARSMKSDRFQWKLFVHRKNSSKSSFEQRSCCLSVGGVSHIPGIRIGIIIIIMTMRPQEDLGVEAKEAAVREVAKLLPVPESLASIASIKVDYALRQQANDAQLSVTVTTQVEQAQAGIEALSASQKTIQMLQQNFLLIDKYSLPIF